MHRVKCTRATDNGAVYIDLDAAPLITRGSVNMTNANGAVERTLPCTLVYLPVHLQDGRPLVEFVVETPEDLLSMAAYDPSVEPARPQKKRRAA